jgi:hypothetical protein
MMKSRKPLSTVPPRLEYCIAGIQDVLADDPPPEPVEVIAFVAPEPEEPPEPEPDDALEPEPDDPAPDEPPESEPPAPEPPEPDPPELEPPEPEPDPPSLARESVR